MSVRFDPIWSVGSGGLLGQLGQLREGGGVVDGQLGQHLAVDGHAGGLQTVHEAGVVHAVDLAGRGDAGDPQLTEIALLQAAAGSGTS